MTTKSEGKHFDEGKLRLDLITPEMQVAQAAVLTYGAKKYGDNNWEKGIAWHKLFGSALRHLWKWWAGEDIDPESGLHHLWHAYCNVGFLITYAARGTCGDDRDGRSCYPWTDPEGKTVSSCASEALRGLHDTIESTDSWAEGHADDAMEREAEERAPSGVVPSLIHKGKWVCADCGRLVGVNLICECSVPCEVIDGRAHDHHYVRNETGGYRCIRCGKNFAFPFGV